MAKVTKHIGWVFLATIFFGLFVIGVPDDIVLFSPDGLVIALFGVLLLCFLPAAFITLCLAGFYSLSKKRELSAAPVLLWVLWGLPAALMLVGAQAEKYEIAMNHTEISTTDPEHVAEDFFMALRDSDSKRALSHVLPKDREAFATVMLEPPALPEIIEVEVGTDSNGNSYAKLLGSEIATDLRYENERWYIAK